MFVVIDMIFAVAEVAVTAAAVAEFQLRVGDIGAAADGAAVEVVLFYLLLGLGEMNGLLGGVLLFGFAFCTPGAGEQIQHVFTVEQEIVCKTYQGE